MYSLTLPHSVLLKFFVYKKIEQAETFSAEPG